MDVHTGVEQRRLRRMTAHWGPQSREHLAIVPVFDSGYKVFGVVGLDSDGPPVWYPGVPLVVEPRRLVFRSSLSDASPTWSEVPPDLFRHAYFFDSWGAIQVLVPHAPGAPSMDGSQNLAGNRIRGQEITDLVFEPALHRVRAMVLRARWGRTERVPILLLPALTESLQISSVPPLAIDALGPPPERPESMLARFVRVLVRPLLQHQPRGR